ncbi:MAG TPA: hypothetical protein DCS67_11685 [Clostridiales bacterium UBA8960]|nr:hypothetical protein [Clostridiales bacterium UBA8960]
MHSTKKTARLAGLLFLMMVIFGLLAEVMFRQKLFVANDVVLTANNIMSNLFLYRAGIISDLLMTLCYLFTALALYKLLSSVDKQMATAMVIFASAGCVLLMFNILIELAPLYILSGNAYLVDFSTAQQQSLAMFFYNLYQHGYMIGQIFFGLWVLPLGGLIIKSGFIPKIFGHLFIIEALFALTSVFIHFLVPNGTLETVLMLPMMVAEFSFMFYLLIRGINERQLVKPLIDLQS